MTKIMRRLEVTTLYVQQSREKEKSKHRTRKYLVEEPSFVLIAVWRDLECRTFHPEKMKDLENTLQTEAVSLQKRVNARRQQDFVVK